MRLAGVGRVQRLHALAAAVTPGRRGLLAAEAMLTH